MAGIGTSLSRLYERFEQRLSRVGQNRLETWATESAARAD